MIDLDQALLWVTWAAFAFFALGLFAGATLAFVARLEERTPVVIGEQLHSTPALAEPSSPTVRQRRGGL